MRASRTAREGAGSEPVEISTSAGTPRTPTPFPVQRVHGERVTSSASPAAQQQMWPALITKKGEFLLNRVILLLHGDQRAQLIEHARQTRENKRNLRQVMREAQLLTEDVLR